MRAIKNSAGTLSAGFLVSSSLWLECLCCVIGKLRKETLVGCFRHCNWLSAQVNELLLSINLI